MQTISEELHLKASLNLNFLCDISNSLNFAAFKGLSKGLILLMKFRKSYFSTAFLAFAVASLSFLIFLFPLHAQRISSKNFSIQQKTIPLKKKKLIIIDPGHGGFDMGATTEVLVEKNLSLEMADVAKKHLSKMGYRVILTRTRDEFVPLEKRALVANQTKSHLFLSLHFNAYKDPQPHGIEIFYYSKGEKERSHSSKRLAKLVLARILSRTKAASRGVKSGNLHVIRNTEMPAILIEGGFLTHPQEHARLADPKYIEEMGRAIAEGVDKYFRTK